MLFCADGCSLRYRSAYETIAPAAFESRDKAVSVTHAIAPKRPSNRNISAAGASHFTATPNASVKIRQNIAAMSNGAAVLLAFELNPLHFAFFRSNLDTFFHKITTHSFRKK
jgi:hypothetical protein